MRIERTSYGQRIVNSFVGLLIGILMFFGSFVVLFINEGRENLGNYARTAILYDQGGTYGPDQLVYKTGNLSATTYAGDSFLNEGQYLSIERIVEMYGYIEHESSQTKENLGGSTTTITTYSYDVGWTSSPQQTSTFKGDQTELPANIPANYNSWIAGMPLNQSQKASGLSMDGVSVDSSVALSGTKPLAVTQDTVKTLSLGANDSVDGGLIFRKNSTTGSSGAPGVGDIRITFRGIMASDRGILLGRVDNGSFVTFQTKKGNPLFRFFVGTETPLEAAGILTAEYRMMLWILRLVGFLMMFFGLLLFASPIMTLISVIPLFAKIGRFVYGIVAFIISFVLTGLTILISMIFHNVYLAIGAVLLLVIIVALILSAKKKNKQNKKKLKYEH